MNKNVLIILAFVAACLTGWSQYYETYPTSQRYMFNYLPDPDTNYYDMMWGGSPIYNIDHLPGKRDIMLTKYHIPENSSPIVVYGVAFPLMDYENCNTNNDTLVDFFIDLFKSQKGKAHVLETALDNKIYSKANGDNIIAGNFIQFPWDLRFFCFDTNVTNYFFETFPTVEVFFDEPYVIRDSFFVAIDLPYNDISSNYLEPCLLLVNTLSTYCNTYNNTIRNDSVLMHSLYGCNGWGAIFPIVAPFDQCAKPLMVNVKPNNRRGMSVIWDAQYGNSSFELEWGPEGFVEGTGTLITSIMPDTDYSCRVELDSLDNATAYTVRVRAQCDVTGGYSGWTEKNFLSETWYSVQAQVNNEEWGTVIGTGDYREGSVAELWAYPLGNHADFVMWNDSLGSRIRYVTVTQDTMFYAYFSCDTCGDGITAVGNDAKVAIFPNPAESHITLSAKEQILTVTIHDIHGQELMVRNGTGTETTIDTKDLPSGIYVVTVTLPSSTVTRKLILR